MFANDCRVTDLPVALSELEIGEPDGARVVGHFGVFQRPAVQVHGAEGEEVERINREPGEPGALSEIPVGEIERHRGDLLAQQHGLRIEIRLGALRVSDGRDDHVCGGGDLSEYESR